jgi:hypothetical protein
VEVLQSGETASHVFQGQVVMRTEGAGDGKVESGEWRVESEKQSPKTQDLRPKTEILLSAGQSARVEKDAKSGELKLTSGEQAAASAQEKFVRRLREPPKLLDLLDIVAGGNGLGNRRERGIDPTTGMEDPLFVPRNRGGDSEYKQVTWHKLIDGVFVPDGRTGKVRLDSAGHAFDGFPQTCAMAWGSIWPRAAEVKPDFRTMDRYYWVYAITNAKRFMPQGRGLLGIHSDTGITFDLEAIRRVHEGAAPSRLRALAGLGDVRRLKPDATTGLVDLWIFIDGKLTFKREQIRLQDGAIVLDQIIGPNDRFLTLVVTDGDGLSRNYDFMVLGDPVLEMTATASANWKEVSDLAIERNKGAK